MKVAAMPSTGPNFTPTEKRIIQLLERGGFYTEYNLRCCLGDDLMETSTIRVHIYNLRKKLREQGRDVLCRRMGNSSSYCIIPGPA